MPMVIVPSSSFSCAVLEGAASELSLELRALLASALTILPPGEFWYTYRGLWGSGSQSVVWGPETNVIFRIILR